MPTHEELVLRILREAGEPLLPSEIVYRLNREFRSGAPLGRAEVVAVLQALQKEVVQLPDETWVAKRSQG